MTDRSRAMFTRTALAFAGITIALWPLVHPWGHLAGAEVGRSARWIASHTFHFLTGVLLVFALTGLAVGRHRLEGTFETWSRRLALLGSVLFAGTGMFSAFVWPVMAVHAPALVDANGPFFKPPHLMIPVASGLVALGWVLYAVALGRAHATTWLAAGLVIAGFVGIILPPRPVGPFPWVTFLIGGVAAAIGLAKLAHTVRLDHETAPAPAAPAAQPRTAARV